MGGRVRANRCLGGRSRFIDPQPRDVFQAGIDQEDIVAASQAAPEENEDRGVGTRGEELKIHQSHRSTNTHWLVGGLEHEFMTFHILGIVTPTDKLIFFRGVGIPPTSNYTLW